MTFSYDTGSYNVEGSVRAWLGAALVANTAPLVGAVPLRVDWPQRPLDPPCFTFVGLGGSPSPITLEGSRVDGGKTGTLRWALAEIDCWESQQHANYQARLAQMGDVLTASWLAVLKTGGSIPIYDFYTSPSAPAALAYRITLYELSETAAAPDPNPDIMRRRFVLKYRWIERIS